MIEATIAMAAMAALFVVFGALRVADRSSCGGSCRECEAAAGCGGSAQCASGTGPECEGSWQGSAEGAIGSGLDRRAPRETGGTW